MVEIGDILVLVCASGRAVRLSGPILNYRAGHPTELATSKTHQNLESLHFNISTTT